MKNNYSKLLTISILIIVCINPIFSNAKYIKNEKPVSINKYDSIKYLNAQSSYDYGYKCGRQYRNIFRLLDVISNLIINKKQIKNSENTSNYKEKYSASSIEKFKGLSDATKIDLNRLISISRFLHNTLGNTCTTIAATSPATKNNQNFLTQNIDPSKRGINGFLWRLYTYKFWISNIDSENYSYMYFGIPVLFERPILNEKGLGWGVNQIAMTKNESREVDEGPGVLITELIKLTMETCKNVSEVATLWKSVEKTSEEGYQNMVYCDREGGILMIEFSHSHIICVFGNSTDITKAPEGILWHANHHQWLDPNLTGSKFPYEYPSSAMRAERARELLECNYGNITLETCKNICRDHNGGWDKNRRDSADICRHGDLKSKSFSIISWVIQPMSNAFYCTHGPPCRFRYIKYDFSDIFNLS